MNQTHRTWSQLKFISKRWDEEISQCCLEMAFVSELAYFSVFLLFMHTFSCVFPLQSLPLVFPLCLFRIYSSSFYWMACLFSLSFYLAFPYSVKWKQCLVLRIPFLLSVLKNLWVCLSLCKLLNSFFSLTSILCTH